MSQTVGFATHAPEALLERWEFARREPGPRDVQIEILFCGVCHSDIHQARNEWGGSSYPMVPGHEIVGRVVHVGDKVKKFKVGDRAGVGCMVDSCRECPDCKEGLEQYCRVGATFTYNSPDKISGGSTYGGYSKTIVVDEDFVLNMPEKLDAAASAPLLCAGITTYSPLKHWSVGKGDVVGIVGLGGLGHMGIKLAKAFGADVVLFTTSPGKTADARKLGADEVVISRNEEEMKKQTGRIDFIIDTVGAPHDLNAYLALLKRDGTMCLVGLPEAPPPPLNVAHLIFRRRSLAGSGIGGIKETQEMLDFCAKHNIVSDIEKIRMDQVNEAYTRMLKNDVKYRFVIDLATLK